MKNYEEHGFIDIDELQRIENENYQKQYRTNFYEELNHLNKELINQTLTNNNLIKPRKDQLVETIGRIYNFQLNELTNQIEIERKPIPGNFLNTLYIELAERYKLDINSQKAIDTVYLISRRNSYHPVKNYLDNCNQSLEKNIWDNLGFHCFGLEDKSATLHIQRQLIASIARIYKAPCKVDTALVLQSDQQGIGKGKFWEAIGGDWYSSSLGDLKNIKEDKIILHSAWIHEWGEIDRVIGMQSSEQIKSFISEQWDNIRLPYERSASRLNRKCILVGTTNKRDFIKDPTGNRRFPIISPKYINYDWVIKNRDHILASAKVAFQTGEKWWYSSEEIKEINKVALQYAPHDPLKDAIEDYLDQVWTKDEICIPQILIGLKKEEQKLDKQLTRGIAIRLQQLGWVKQNKRGRFNLSTLRKSEKTTIYLRPSSKITH